MSGDPGRAQKCSLAVAALDELLESGTLTDYSGGDEIESELARVKAKNTVDDEMARLKAEMNK